MKIKYNHAFYETKGTPYRLLGRKRGQSPQAMAASQKEEPMRISKTALAGTLESSDCQVTVEPAETLELSVESSVENQYGEQIKESVLDVLNDLDVKSGTIKLVDKGALDCTIRARVSCAVFRSADASMENIPWGGAVR